MTTDDQDPATEPSTQEDRAPVDHLAQLKRRVPFYLLVVALAVLVVRYYQRQPSDVTVEYRLGPAAEGLTTLRARYYRGSELVHRVSFESLDARAGQRSAPVHSVRLTEGDYEARVELVYRERVPRAIRSTSRPLGPRSVRMRRPLPVRGAGRYTVVIAEDD